MKTIHFQSWSDFLAHVQQIRRTTGPPHDGDILFRGQADSEWPLATTLERRSSREFTVVEYAALALTYEPKLRSETGKRWETMVGEDLYQWPRRINSKFDIEMPCYPYMIYLRQHGFASPLLDWTESPFVAAYFAFHEPGPRDGCAAVYAYSETSQDNLKLMSLDKAMISLRGPFVETHPRHFTQQAWYTICGKWDSGTTPARSSPRGHVICSHSEVFDRGGDTDQDILTRMIIPRSERRTVLEFMRDVNINHFTLFRTEDALVQTVDVDAFDLSL